MKISEYNCLVDLWSIGCVLFQCLAGKVPFEEQDLCKLFLHVACSNFYDTCPELPPATPQNDVDLINGLLEIDRSKRISPDKFYAMAVKRMQQAREDV